MNGLNHCWFIARCLCAALFTLSFVACGGEVRVDDPPAGFDCESIGGTLDDDGNCAIPVPTDVVTSECSEDSECPDGRICANGTCVPGQVDTDEFVTAECTDDESCPDGETCENGTCIPESADSATCETDADCAEGNLCVDGDCQADNEAFSPACETDADCAEGWICEDRACGPDTAGLVFGECEDDDDCTLPGLYCGTANICLPQNTDSSCTFEVNDESCLVAICGEEEFTYCPETPLFECTFDIREGCAVFTCEGDDPLEFCPDIEPECTSDEECAEGEVCTDGICEDAPMCAEDTDGDGVCDDEDSCPLDADAVPARYYWDADGDGLGSFFTRGDWCPSELVPGWVTNDDDECPTMFAETDNGCPEEVECELDDPTCDFDGDGANNEDDCWPDDPLRFDPLTWYQDEDGDSLGDPDVVVEACEMPEGYTDNSDDQCDAPVGCPVTYRIKYRQDDVLSQHSAGLLNVALSLTQGGTWGQYWDVDGAELSDEFDVDGEPLYIAEITVFAYMELDWFAYTDGVNVPIHCSGPGVDCDPIPAEAWVSDYDAGTDTTAETAIFPIEIEEVGGATYRFLDPYVGNAGTWVPQPTWFSDPVTVDP